LWYKPSPDAAHCPPRRIFSKTLTPIIFSDLLASVTVDMLILRCLFGPGAAVLEALGGGTAHNTFYNKCILDHDSPGARDELEKTWKSWMRAK
jgi:hypothetical protein